jgi:hypothetical protein
MDNRDCLKVLLGGKSVRLPTWAPNTYVFLEADGRIMCHYYDGSELSEPDVFIDALTAWELYEPKREVLHAPAIYRNGSGEVCVSMTLHKAEDEDKVREHFSRHPGWEFIKLDWNRAVEIEEWVN